MPFIKICVTKENDKPTIEQKKHLIEGVTNLVSDILGRNKNSTVVIIDEIEADNYGLGGKSITEVRQEQSKKENLINLKTKMDKKSNKKKTK